MPNSIVPVPMLGGVNLLDAPRRIGDQELIRSQNMAPVQPGHMQTRLASGYFGKYAMFGGGKVANFLVSPFEGSLFGAIVRKESSPSRTTLTAVVDNGDPVAIGPEDLRKPALIAFQNKIYCFPGYSGNATGYVISSVSPDVLYTPTTFAFNGTGNSDLRPHVVGIYRNRFVYGNFGPGFESSLVMSDRFDPATVGNSVLAANGRNFSVGAGDGDRIVAIVEIMQTAVGSPAESACLVLKEYSAWLLTGEPNLVADGDLDFADFKVNRISFESGCSSPETVVTTPYGVMWTGPDDVWSFSTGQLPVRVGTKIRPWLQATPADKRFLWCAGYFNGFYRIAGFSPGYGPVDTTPCNEQYWLDLRNGPPQDFRNAAWYGPQIYNFHYTESGIQTQIGMSNMSLDRKKNREQYLYFMGGDSGLEIFTVDASPSERDAPAADVTVVQQTADEIETQLWTKVYDYGAPVQRKLYQGAELDVVSSIATRVYWDLILDEGREVSTGNTEVLGPIDFEADIDQADVELLTQENQAILLHPSVSSRYLGKTHQLKIYSQAGYEIIEGVNDTLEIAFSATNGADPDIIFSAFTGNQIVLTPGRYVSATQLAAHINVLIATALTPFSLICAVGYNGTTGTIDFTPTTGFTGVGGVLIGPHVSLETTYRLLSMLGFNPAGSYQGFPGVATSGDPIYPTRAPIWEFDTLALKIRLVNRRPQ